MYAEYLFLADALTHDETIQVPVLDEDGNPVYDDETGDPIMEDEVIQVTNYPHHMATQVGMLDERYVVLALHTSDPLLPGDTLVTYRAADDAASTIVDEDLFEQLRPFGNSPDGTATGVLLYSYLAGFPARLFDNGRAYPPGNEPFDIEIRPWFYDEYADPNHGGWGWCAEMAGGHEERNPASRAVFVDAAPEGLAAGYTTGAFVLAESKWQVDEEGTPLQVWQTITPPGRNSVERGDWTLTVLHGSAREGTATLHSAEDRIRYLFWEHNQPGTPGEVEPWVSGTVYNTGDKVTHVGKLWNSTTDGNHWEPGVVHSVWVEIARGIGKNSTRGKKNSRRGSK